jgi:hypothetical protein
LTVRGYDSINTERHSLGKGQTRCNNDWGAELNLHPSAGKMPIKIIEIEDECIEGNAVGRKRYHGEVPGGVGVD